MDQLDEKHQTEAAAAFLGDDETAFDIQAAIACNDMGAIYRMADRIAVMDLPQWLILRRDVVEHFKKAAGIKDLDRIIGEFRLRANKSRPNGVYEKQGDWQKKLNYSELGKLLPTVDNASILFENHSDWHGVLWYNELTGGYDVRAKPPEPCTSKVGAELDDSFDVHATRWLERQGVVTKIDVIRKVVDAVTHDNPYHPVREYLECLPEWDHTPRLTNWLPEYCGVASSDSEPNLYAMAIGEKFLISAVARIMQPGCKADHVLILEGEQGIGKSTAVKILGGKWFTDQVADFGSKDASMQIRGSWIIELPELAVLSRSDLERAKAFITATEERFRPPYGKRVVAIQRQCVFIGTTNSDSWLSDETGGRRFWPVKCGTFKLTELARDRDQLWAEALLRYCQGVKWHLDDRRLVVMAAKEQKDRYRDDVWQVPVESAAEQAPDGTSSVREILQRIGVDPAHQDQVNSNRVARCLRRAGYIRFKATKGYAIREWRYRKSYLLDGQEEE